MNDFYIKSLERNIAIYCWYKIFIKRLYLPISAIQLVSVGQVTIAELALITICTIILQGTLQVPTGYFADVFGNKKSVVLGALIATFSPIFYVVMPNFWGGLFASLLYFGGCAFIAGAIEALIHDTLIALKRDHEYTKVMGRAQTYGLIGNTLLIILVPATYTIHHTLPFILGFISLATMTFLTTKFINPLIHSHVETNEKKVRHALQNVFTLRNTSVFVLAGFLTAAANQSLQYKELYLQEQGLPITLLGSVLAAGSVIGAVLGWYIHVFDMFSSKVFYIIDTLILSGCLIIMGIGANLISIVAAVVVFTGYSRVRQIVFQGKLLKDIKHAYKATLLSSLDTFTAFGSALLTLVLAHFIINHGFSSGYLYYGTFVLVVGLILTSGTILTSCITSSWTPPKDKSPH